MSTKIPRKQTDWKHYDRSLAVAAHRIANSDIPSSDELAGIIEANIEKPLPKWLLKTVCAQLRGEIKRKRGRKRQSEWREIFVAIAAWDYRRHIAWLKRRKKSQGLIGWSCIKDAAWWKGPPHERALAIVYELYREMADAEMIGLRRFRNLISSRK